MTELDIVKLKYNLKKFRRLETHPNCFKYTEYPYPSGTRGFFGPTIYSNKCVYQEVFEWETNEGEYYGIAIEPTVVYKNGYPVEDWEETTKILCGFIEQTINNSVTQR